MTTYLSVKEVVQTTIVPSRPRCRLSATHSVVLQDVSTAAKAVHISWGGMVMGFTQTELLDLIRNLDRLHGEMCEHFKGE